MKNCHLLFFIIFSIFFSYCTQVHSMAHGHVIDSNQNPIEGAHVIFTDELNPENSFSGITDDEGFYEIAFSPISVKMDKPFQFTLGQNYPNPFNPTTTIPFTLDESAHVRMTIYNIMGQKVITVLDNYMNAGNHTVIWNGFDQDGNHVSAGIYLYQLNTGQHTETRKMLLLDGGGITGGTRYSAEKSVSRISKTAEETTYTVTITHDSIVPYEETGLTVTDGQTLDFVVSLINDNLPSGLTFAFIPSGTFEMGDELSNLDESCRPVHTVTVTDFKMSICEITNAQYIEYMEAALDEGLITVTTESVTGASGEWNGIKYIDLDDPTSDINYIDNEFHLGAGRDSLPVFHVTWYGAKAFAEFYNLDLPTEAEWEYACRGGEQYLFGTDDGTISKTKADYDDEGTHQESIVGSFPPNPFGLYDMSGNVFEWCRDWYGDYSDESVYNPTGIPYGTHRVIRGGCYDSQANYCRSAYRRADLPTRNSKETGFRVVLRKEGDGTSFNHILYGEVIFNDSGLEGVTVSMAGMQTITSSNGRYTFTGLSDGIYTITFVKDGYTFNPSSVDISISGYNIKADNVIASETGNIEIPDGLIFTSIPSGSFEMGDELGDLHRGTRPVHTVTLSEFEMSIYEITNAQYVEYLNAMLALDNITITDEGVDAKAGIWIGQNYLYLSFAECGIDYSAGRFSVKTGKKNHPVFGVSWFGAKAFANYYGCDLPTEAEWEYGCRGGQQNIYGTDDGTITPAKANYDWSIGTTTEVGSYEPNPFGLHDMSGNIREWCHDWTAVYPSESEVNPTGPSTGDSREMRGGYWNGDVYFCRSAARDGYSPSSTPNNAGFRIVRRPEGLIY